MDTPPFQHIPQKCQNPMDALRPQLDQWLKIIRIVEDIVRLQASAELHRVCCGPQITSTYDVGVNAFVNMPQVGVIMEIMCISSGTATFLICTCAIPFSMPASHVATLYR